MKTTYSLLATGLAAQQVAATWNFYDNFKTPQYNDNECSDQQKSGFDWSSLKDGDKNFQYDDFDFSGGWSCSNSLGKRDILTKRTFGTKVVKNSVSKDKPASFGCDQRKSGFSITDIDVSAEFDVELELHYTMTDGSKCKSYSSCSSGGSTIKNTQCGGATSVEVYLGTHYTGDKSECEIGLHHIGFDCNPGTGYNTPSPPAIPTTTPVESKSAVSTPPTTESTAAPSCSGGEAECTSQPPATPTGGVAVPPTCEGETCYPQSTPEASTSPATDAPPAPPATGTCDGTTGEACNTPVQTQSEVPSSSIAPFTNSSAPAYTSPPTQETPAVSPPSYQTNTVTPLPETSTGVAPPPLSTDVSTGVPVPCDGSYGQSCSESTDVPSPPPSSNTGVPIPLTSTLSPAAQPSPSPSPSPSPPPADVSSVLPKCLNSWLQISSSCKDNTDKSCYCVNPDFTKNVIDCVTAWCGTDAETKQTLQYLIGICADYVPQNPGLVGDVPSYIPLGPGAPATTPSATPTGGVTGGVTGGISSTVPAGETTTPAPALTPTPATTPTPAPASPPTDIPCTTITYGTTSLTVPQVHFTTQTPLSGGTGTNTAYPTAPVGLVPGTAPPQASATTTGGAGTAPPYPIPSTLGTMTTGLAGTATGTGGIRPSAPAEFTGAASALMVVGASGAGAWFGGAVIALLAL